MLTPMAQTFCVYSTGLGVPVSRLHGLGMIREKYTKLCLCTKLLCIYFYYFSLIYLFYYRLSGKCELCHACRYITESNQWKFVFLVRNTKEITNLSVWCKFFEEISGIYFFCATVSFWHPGCNSDLGPNKSPRCWKTTPWYHCIWVRFLSP